MKHIATIQKRAQGEYGKEHKTGRRDKETHRNNMQ